jgi:hypothetical protein
LMVVDGKRPRRPEGIADDHWNMIQSCWKPPRVRPLSEDILSFVTAQRSKQKFDWSSARCGLNFYRSPSIVTSVLLAVLYGQRSINVAYRDRSISKPCSISSVISCMQL